MCWISVHCLLNGGLGRAQTRTLMRELSLEAAVTSKMEGTAIDDRMRACCREFQRKLRAAGDRMVGALALSVSLAVTLVVVSRLRRFASFPLVSLAFGLTVCSIFSGSG